MRDINRSLIILKPKQPFLDWLKTQDDKLEDLTLERLAEDSTAYLIPELWDDKAQDEILKVLYADLFEEELEAWWQDETVWPKKRSFKTFEEWFEVDFHSLVFDLCLEPLYDEEPYLEDD